jgi:putative restriction endonuclease
VGGGIFAYATNLPLSLAWESFGVANGATTLTEMRRRIAKYRRAGLEDRGDFPIGCRILTQPFFFEEHDWVPVPSSWSDNIVSLKAFTTSTDEGLALWDAVTKRLDRTAPFVAEPNQRFGAPQLVRPRLGQGAFRVVVTDDYQRRCAITGEKTLPALDAAHIRPYGEGGEHAPSYGLLLRRDIHSLFDAGYVTVSPNMRFEVSSKIREEFENGRHYYALHGQLIAIPKTLSHRPDANALSWHNEHVFKG